MRKAAIITEGGKGIGFGHITRCLSMCQALEEKGIKPEFIINADASVTVLLKGQRYRLFNWLARREEFFKSIKSYDLIIVDSYLAPKHFYNRISETAKKGIYIDDDKRISYPRGIVVNGGIDAEDIDYPSGEGIKYLLGIRYVLLKKEFWETPQKKIKARPKRIMVMFGGCDIQNMTPKVLRFLNDAYPNMVKDVIIGKGFKNINATKRIHGKNINLICFPEAKTIKKVMAEADIAVSAGGQTMYELARMGVPTIAVTVADNQIKETRALEKAGFIDYAGWWQDKAMPARLNMALDRLMDCGTRQKRSKTGRRLVDGKGPHRIVSFLLRMDGE